MNVYLRGQFNAFIIRVTERWVFPNFKMDSIIQWSTSTKIMVCVLGGVISIGIEYIVLIKSTIDHYQKLQQKELVLKQDFESKQQQTSHVHLLQEQVQLLQSQYQAVLKKLIVPIQVPNVLEQVSKLGVNNGLYFESFTPLPEKKRDFYSELPVKIRILGHYQQEMMFLMQVAQMNPLASWHDFEITPLLLNDGRDKDQLNIHITLKIYRRLKKSKHVFLPNDHSLKNSMVSKS